MAIDFTNHAYRIKPPLKPLTTGFRKLASWKNIHVPGGWPTQLYRDRGSCAQDLSGPHPTCHYIWPFVSFIIKYNSNWRVVGTPRFAVKTERSEGNLGTWHVPLTCEVRAVLWNWALKPVRSNPDSVRTVGHLVGVSVGEAVLEKTPCILVSGGEKTLQAPTKLDTNTCHYTFNKLHVEIMLVCD